MSDEGVRCLLQAEMSFGHIVRQQVLPEWITQAPVDQCEVTRRCRRWQVPQPGCFLFVQLPTRPANRAGRHRIEVLQLDPASDCCLMVTASQRGGRSF